MFQRSQLTQPWTWLGGVRPASAIFPASSGGAAPKKLPSRCPRSTAARPSPGRRPPRDAGRCPSTTRPWPSPARGWASSQGGGPMAAVCHGSIRGGVPAFGQAVQKKRPSPPPFWWRALGQSFPSAPAAPKEFFFFAFVCSVAWCWVPPTGHPKPANAIQRCHPSPTSSTPSTRSSSSSPASPSCCPSSGRRCSPGSAPGMPACPWGRLESLAPSVTPHRRPNQPNGYLLSLP